MTPIPPDTSMSEKIRDAVKLDEFQKRRQDHVSSMLFSPLAMRGKDRRAAHVGEKMARVARRRARNKAGSKSRARNR